jgi:hypothetical protein
VSELEALVSNPVAGNPCEVNKVFVNVTSVLPVVIYVCSKEHAAVLQYAPSQVIPVPVFCPALPCPALPQFHHQTGGDGAKSELFQCRSCTSMFPLYYLCVHRVLEATLAKTGLLENLFCSCQTAIAGGGLEAPSGIQKAETRGFSLLSWSLTGGVIGCLGLRLRYGGRGGQGGWVMIYDNTYFPTTAHPYARSCNSVVGNRDFTCVQISTQRPSAAIHIYNSIPNSLYPFI